MAIEKRFASEDYVEEKNNVVLNNANDYTDEKVADLVNSAPETLDTLGELATAFNENQEVVEALDAAITNKADKEHTHTWDSITDKPNYITLTDTINGYKYIVEMQNGTLVSYCIDIVGITVSSLPSKTEYSNGEAFDPTGMVVMAEYVDGTTREVTDFTYPETVTEPTVVIAYGDYSAEIEVTILSVEDMLVDFEYTANEDGTYTLTGWKETLNGVASTECVIPDSNKIVL